MIMGCTSAMAAGKMTQRDDSDDNTAAKARRPRRAIILLVLVVLAAIMLNIFAGITDWKRDLTTNFAKLDAQSDDPLLRPLTISDTPENVADRIDQWAAQQPQWSVESRQQKGLVVNMHLTHTSKLLRFTDDVHVQLLPDKIGTRVEAESQSRIGKADFGQNPRNLRELVRGLSEAR
jgi:uncharacterized protein (DUF1499 family)